MRTLLVVSASCVGILVTGHGVRTEALSAPQAACRASLATDQHPEAIPDYVVWEGLFNEVGRPGSTLLSDVGADPRWAALVNARAADARAAARRAPLHNVTNASAAAAILQSRDRLIRDLPPALYRELERQAISYARNRPYEIPVAGLEQQVTAVSGILCVVTVRGRDYPHLVPTSTAWRNLFRAMTELSAPHRLGPRSFDDTFLRNFRAGSLPMTADEQAHVLEVAREATLAMQQATDRASAAEIALTARASLMRTLSSDRWAVVNQRAESLVAGTHFTFPPSSRYLASAKED